jgi:hypothetical protein
MLLAIAAACSGGGRGGGGGGGGGQPPTPTALAAWETVRSVFQHARCQNCHPAGNVPLQGDEGRPHAQNVQRGPAGRGMVGAECTTCHGPANLPDSYGARTPPGVSNGWHMPTPELPLVFVGLSSGDLCRQLKDPAKNGGKDMAALRVHLDDPLVQWAWSPGLGRTPIPTSRDTFLAAWEAWASNGAPCP